MLIGVVKIYLSAQHVSEVHFVVDHYRCAGKWGERSYFNGIGPVA